MECFAKLQNRLFLLNLRVFLVLDMSPTSETKRSNRKAKKKRAVQAKDNQSPKDNGTSEVRLCIGFGGI